jgi:hypothetical protein
MGDGEPDISDFSAGECLFQPDRELFYVVTDVNDDSIEFAIHGWQTIDKDRLQNYLQENSEGNKFFVTEDELQSVITDSETQQEFENLKDMVFTVYANSEKYADSDP